MREKPSPAITTATDTVVLTALRRQLTSAFPPSPWIYWCDLSISALIGWSALLLGIAVPLFSLLSLVATVIAIVALLRATIFIHELAHLKHGAVPGLELVWNLVVGIPFLLPSVMYDSHGDHHRQATFATASDPEYAPIAQWSSIRMAWFVVSMIFVPLLLAVRWGLAGPLSFFVPPLRRLLIARASSLVINPHYRRPQPRPQERLRWHAQEVATALVCWSAIVAIWYGTVPLFWVWHWYVVAAGVAVVNQVRTLAAHRYTNDGRQLSVVEQLLDSINLTGPPLPTVLAAPVGLRYHAAHHFLPNVPYHSLGKLHRQLVAQLTLDSPYHRAEEPGIVAAIVTLMQPSTRPVQVPLPSVDHPAAES